MLPAATLFISTRPAPKKNRNTSYNACKSIFLVSHIVYSSRRLFTKANWKQTKEFQDVEKKKKKKKQLEKPCRKQRNHKQHEQRAMTYRRKNYF